MLPLMMKNKLVMEIDFDATVYHVIDEKVLSFSMQCRIKRVPDFTKIHSKYDDIQK